MAFENLVYSTAIADGMPSALALLIVAQSKHESNDYTSSLFRDCNNAFGYGYGQNSCNGHPYKGYNSIVDSTHDLTAWIKRKYQEGNFDELNTITDPDRYAQLLSDNGYYTDSVDNYAAGLKRWFTSNLSTIAGISLLGIAVGVGIFYLLFRKELHIYK